MLNSDGTKRTYRKITSLILFGDAVVAVAVAVAVVVCKKSCDRDAFTIVTSHTYEPKN